MERSSNVSNLFRHIFYMILLTDATGVNPAVKLALPQEAEEKVTPLAETKARKKVAKNVKQGIFNLLYIYRCQRLLRKRSRRTSRRILVARFRRLDFPKANVGMKGRPGCFTLASKRIYIYYMYLDIYTTSANISLCGVPS